MEPRQALERAAGRAAWLLAHGRAAEALVLIRAAEALSKLGWVGIPDGEWEWLLERAGRRR